MRNRLIAWIVRRTAPMLMVGVIAVPAVSTLAAQTRQQPYTQSAPVNFTADQLDNLVAPIALYADPLLAQVLLAATFPDQVVNAAQYVRTNGTNGIDDQYWDVSVKAVAHYPTVLNMMDQKIDWTTSLGQAYAIQSTDVMQAVQHMRALANDQGNLQDSQQQQVVYQGSNIAIWPAQPQYIYVPVYDPAVIFFRPIYVRPSFTAYFGFGAGYPIGAWLMYDYDWPARRIVYTGWNGGGWIARSRPYVRVTNVYVNAGYRNVYWNRNVVYSRPDYGHVRVYSGLGHNVNFRDHGGSAAPNGGRYAQPHGEVTPGGYRQPQSVNTGARSSHGSNQYQPAPRSPVEMRPQHQSQPQEQPRYVEPRTAHPVTRSAPPVSHSAPSQSHSAPAASHSAPAPSHPAPSHGRTAHRSGGGGR